MFKDGWVVINEVPTHVQTWGGWIEDKITSDSVIICITGNPGITSFYCVFLSALHDQTGLPVWVINHAGLEFPPESEKMAIPSLNSNPHLYDLNGQITHKLKFVQRYAGQDLKLYLIGHSAGAKMVTGMLGEQGMMPRVNQTYFLFPTLEHIAKSPFGQLHVKYGKYFLRVTLCLTKILCLFPLFVKRWIVITYLRLRRKADPVESAVEAALQLLNPKAVRAALFLAKDEMININDLDLEVLLELGDRVNCYFGQNDGWAPVWQSEDIRKQCPNASVTVLDPKHKHAFVLSSPREISDIISNHIMTKRGKNLSS